MTKKELEENLLALKNNLNIQQNRANELKENLTRTNKAHAELKRDFDNRTYKIHAKCSNCGHQGSKYIAKGRLVTQARCDICFCKTIKIIK